MEPSVRYDARYWVALGVWNAHLSRYQEAIECLERAGNNNDEQGMAIVKLAELYMRLGDNAKGKRMQRHQEMQERMANVGESVLFLISYCQVSQQLERAQGSVVRS
eukprot:c20321_g4_i1.p1 GENE.c20321_g4_i1~~c20321_g4_i1.p1  ORF type:complete len:106 (-),score=15.34 c20321_g4_i1:103-420(-)